MNTKNAFTMKLSQVADILGTDYQGNDIQLEGISTDTRTLQGGELFVALRGDNFDANEFATKAMEQGAAACILEHPVDGVSNAVIVEDSRIALARLARAWRDRFSIPVIAVTGSNGKTSVKEMVAAILGQQGNVLATIGNLNNDIGVPLTLFRLNDEYDCAVIEMGANHLKEISYLVDIANPDVGIVTNAAEAHLEGFGSLQGVAETKGEMFSCLQQSGVTIINNDDAFSERWHQMAGTRKCITFGLKKQADVTASWQAVMTGNEIEISTPQGHINVHLNLLGEHNVMNALAATAAALAVETPLSVIKLGLESISEVPGRLQLKQGIQGSRIIDDTYNANPGSLKVALEVLRGFPGKHFMALGDMGELGEDACQIHKQAGSQIKEAGVVRLYTFGELSKNAANEFGSNARSFEKHDDMIDVIKNELDEEVILLVKGSRRMKMEKIVDAVSVG